MLMGELLHQCWPRDHYWTALNPTQGIGQPRLDVNDERRPLQRHEGAAVQRYAVVEQLGVKAFGQYEQARTAGCLTAFAWKPA